MPSVLILVWGKCAEEPRAFCFVLAPYIKVIENGYDDYMYANVQNH